MKQSTNRSKTRLYLILALAGLVTLLLWPSLVAAMPLTARHHLERAWTLAADMDRYNYQSTVLQTSHPTLTLGNVGRTARTEQIVIDGRLDRPAELMTMNLAAPNQPPLEVKLEESRAYGRMNRVDGMEDWVEIEAGADLFAPGGDPLGFLNVVENVTQLGQATGQAAAETEYFPVELLPAEMAASISYYQFDISGPKYARQMRAGLEKAMRERGELPGGITLQTPQKYVDMTGHGEIWVSDSGLPMRQIVRLEFPPEPGADVWVEAEITTNFSNWQNPGLTYALLNAIPRVVDDPSILANDPLALFPNLQSPISNLHPDNLQAFGMLLGLSLLLAALGVMAVTHRRSPKFYGGFSLSVIAMMLVTPLLQSQQVHAATTRFYARQANLEQQQATQQSPADSQAEPPASTFNPNQNPLDRSSKTQEVGSNNADNTQLTTDNLQLTIYNSSDSPTPNPHGLIPQRQTTCVITATSDCDGDGLTDNVEIYELGTRIDKIDTDDDGISDGREITPYEWFGTWYLDPLSSDSNGDGISDGDECLIRADYITGTLISKEDAACIDTDLDGRPDVHDYDNDGDGVPDKADINSNAVISVEDNSYFNLDLVGVQTGKNIILDIQVRPLDDRHLAWSNNILDWPDQDNSGQLQRVTPNTLGDGDGDIQLLPMLEVTIPYAEVNPAGSLPVSGAVNITPTTPISDWLDTTVTDEYAMSVRPGPDGAKIVNVPLTLVTDPIGNMPVAWQARLPYRLQPGVTDWGANHQVRVQWFVTGQSDKCTIPAGETKDYCNDPANWTSTTTLLQTYPEQFQVTGLYVQEHHGAEALMVAQTPGTGSSYYEEDLWHLAATIQDIWLGAQLSGGQRFDIGDISTSYTGWGIPGANLKLNSLTGLADDTALFETTDESAVTSFIDSQVYPTDPVSGTLTTVLLAAEETKRSLQLNESRIIGTELVNSVVYTTTVLTVDFNGIDTTTTGMVRWQPYRFNDAGWTAARLSAYLDTLALNLGSVITTNALNNAGIGQFQNVDIARQGSIYLAQNYYLSLFGATVAPLATSGGLKYNNQTVNHTLYQKPAIPALTITTAMAGKVLNFYDVINRGSLDIPTVEAAVDIEASSAYARLAASRATVMEAYGEVVAGGIISAIGEALYEMSDFQRIMLNSSNFNAAYDNGLVYATTGTESVLSGKVGSSNVMNFLTVDGMAIAKDAGIVYNHVWYTQQAKVIEQIPAIENELRVARRLLPVQAERLKDLQIYVKQNYKNISQLNAFLESDISARIFAKDQAEIDKTKLAISVAEDNLETASKALSRAKFWAAAGIALSVGAAALTITQVMASGQISADSPAFSQLLAQQIAGIITAVILAFLDVLVVTTAATALGVVLALVAVIDLIIQVICSATNFDEKRPELASWICGGFVGAFTKALAYVINDTTPLVDLQHDNRLQISVGTPVLGSETGVEGIIAGNSITLNGTVTTTLYMDNPNWMGYLYWWQWTDNYLDDASFAYEFQSADQDIPLDLQETQWDPVPGKRNNSISANDARFRKQQPIQSLQHTFSAPGINQGLAVSLGEGFAVRQQNCWLTVIGVLVTCWLSKYDDTVHLSMENSFIFDVFPATIDEFYTLSIAPNNNGSGYRLAWDERFPVLVDADGDGLRSQGLTNVDPNDSTIDTDADGLTDYFERDTVGFDPEDADSDCDGLTDYWERFYNTNPALPDSDGDGLTDNQEFFHPNRLYPFENSVFSNENPPRCSDSVLTHTGGWPIVYNYDNSGNPLITWVSANPNDFDSDDDSLTDNQERIYAYNPNVASQLNVLSLDTTVETSSGVAPFVSPGGSISYTAVITNELALPYARGLLEAELPLDNVLRTQSLGIVAPKSAVPTNGNIDVAEAGLTTSGPIDMGLRAGAILDDPTGRVLWLHLNEPAGSTIFADDSFLQNDGTCSGGNCPTAAGQALTFDGDDAIIVPDSDSLDVSEYTIDMAVRPTTSGSARTLLRKGETTGPATYDLGLLLELSSSNEVNFVTFYDDCTSQTGNKLTSPALPLNQWSHITTSYDGSTKKLYLNGELVASTTYNQTPCVNNDPLSIGAMFHGGNLFSGFTGQIDEVEIFPSILNDATILANYATPLLQLNLRDSATWGSSGLSCNNADCPATSGNGAAFDQTKYLNVTAPDLSADAFSFATWIKPKSRTAPMNSEAAIVHGKETDRDWQGVFGNMVYDNSQSSWPYATTIYPSLFVSSDGALRMTMANNSPACQLTTNATGLVQNDVWQHMAVSYDGSNFTFYVNGELVTGGLTGASCAGITPPTVSTMYLGRPNDYGYAWIDRLNITDMEDELGQDPWMDARLNLNNDGVDGNIWESGRIDSTGVRAINQSFFVQDGSQWLRLWEYDTGDSKAYQPNPIYGGTTADDNWLHFTNIKNTTYLDLNGYDFEGPSQDSFGVLRTAKGTLYFGVFNDYFEGELDDFRVYNYALNDRVVADIFNSSAVALDLPFDEAPGANLFADESGNYVTVSCSGDTCPTSGVPGRFNQALEFDGVDDYLTIGTASSELGTSEGSFSAMMWIKPDTFRGTNDRGQIPLIDVGDDHRLGLISFGRPGAWAGDIASVDSANSLYNATGRWYHLAYVFENGKYTFYVNGQEKGSDLLAKPGAANTLRIGRETQTVQGNTFDFYFDGLLDDLTIVKRALSQAGVQTYLNRAPAINLHLDEDLSLTSFADDSENRYTATCASGACPDGGDKGQIREAVTFGGSDNLTLANTADLDLTDFSVGLWVKPTKTVNTAQRLMTKSDTSFFNANFRLWLLAGSMTVRFDRQHTCQGSEGNWHTIDAGTPLLENQWNHVLATHDSTNGVMKIYINGALAGTNAAVGNTVCTANSTPIRLGQNFNGGLDEVIVTPAILSDEQVAAIYNYQAAWFDVINQHSIFVDADSPSVDLTLTPAHFSTARTPFYIGVEDASSPLVGVEYRLDGGAWQAAEPNGGDVSSAAWLFYFEEAAGTHTIEARATDSVGNMSAIASATVNVDDQAPTLTLNTAGGVVKVVEDYTFGGTVSDADSGVARNGVTVSTVDHTGNPVSGNQSASVQSNNWQARQPFPEIPYGVYTATVNALDEAGNIATANGLFELDGLPPYADVTDNENYLNLTAAKTLTGIASDVPYPTGGRTLHLHFELVDGLWVDGSDTGFSMVCNAGECPIAGVTGQRGAAISFDGLDDALAFTKDEVMTTTTTVQQLGLTDGSFTVMSWVNAPTWSGDQAILGSSPTTPTDGFYLGLQNGRPSLGYEGDDTAMPDPIPTSEWVHLAWRYDDNSGERAFFINGTLSFTSTGHSAYSLVDEPIALGSARDGSAFGGSLDELVIYAQPLADETIYDIANPLNVGISDLALRIRSYDEREIGQFEGTWNPVSLDNAGQLFTTWAYDLPALATGAYKIDLRVTDAVGNSNFVDGAWDVAVIAPDVLVSKQSDVTLAATGDTISYTIAYTNASPAPATGVVITEVVPVDTTFDAVLSDPGWSCLPDGSAGSNCTLALGTLAAEAGGTLTFTVTAADTWSAGTTAISNTVSIATDGVDGNPADNTDHHQIPIDGGIDLTVVITDGGAVFQYDAESPDEAPPLVYTMTYTNAGSQPAQPQLSINWSQGGGLYSTAPGGWTCEGLTRTCTQALGTLNIGQSGVVTFPLRTSYFVPDDRLITTTVEIEDLAGATEVITGNNTANVVTPIQLDYALVPEQASLTIQEGDVVTNGVELLVPPETDLEFFRFATFPPPSAGEFFGRSFERTAEDLTWQWVYTSTDGLEQTQPVTWYVTIGEGSFIVSTVFSMTVANVAPTVVITGNDTVASGTLYNLSLGEVTDPGDDTVTACTLDWGDSSNEDCLSSLGGGTLSHTYGNNYSKPVITVNLTDEDGTHIAASKTITVTGLSTSLTVDQTSVTAYESETVTNKGTYSPADAAFIWSASEGVVSDEGNGVWSWSRDAGSAESTRPVTITADSQTISFTLTVQGDGVPSSIEAGAPNSGDGNSDGVPDQAQMHVASLPSPLTGDYVTLAASPGLTLTNVSLTATPSAGDGSQPAGIQFPLGYLDFDLTGMGPGGNANVTLLITGTGTSNINSYAQYDALSGWYTFLYDDATDTGAELVSDERIILYLVDGERGDGDGTANGTIANLGGPANQQAAKTLTVNISGSGSVSPPAGDYAQGTVLTMVATPDPGWRFTGWSGALSGSTISQTLTMNQNKRVTAIFSQESYNLTDQVVGNGRISLNPDQSSYMFGDVVTVTATAGPGWRFDGWSGDLSGSTVSQSLTIDSHKSITATFTQDAYTVTTTTSGNGSVILNPDQTSYAYGDQIAVQALPDPGYTFQGWSGDLSSDAPLENLTIDGSKAITAMFTSAVYSVETSVAGSGSITVEPDQAGYSYGDVITATATPATGWSFSGWQLGLSGMTATQALTITSDTNLLAVFEADTYTLNASWIGEGSVVVTPDQPNYSYGQVVTVTAAPGTGWNFTGWSGAISDTALTSTVTMTANRSILATFTPITYTLTVQKDGSGSGTVSAALGGIDCGSDCSESLDYGSVITLTAIPDPGSTFDGWAGPGIAGGTLFTVTITSETVVTATFNGGPVNNPPVLDPIGPQTITETETLTFTAVATDTDDDALTFSLSDAPAGASLDSSGAFTWTTTEADGPDVYSATVIVSDGVLTDSQTVDITVTEVNEAPVLDPIHDQSVVAGETLTFTATATDTDVPTQTLTFSLSDAPAGAQINDTTGVFTWTTSTAGVYSATVIVSDGVLTDSQTISLTVIVDNVAPALDPIEPQTITETETLTFTAVATDANDDLLTFSLSDAPDGAVISSTTGLFSWTPTEADGPGIFSPTVIVSDGVLTDSQTVDITVNEVNEAPVLATILDQTVLQGETVSFTATATDSDVPTQTLTYSLSDAPGGAAIDDSSGVFTWTTAESNDLGVYSATVIVSDGVLTDSQTINITLNDDNTAPVLDPIVSQAITETQTLTFTAVATDAEDDPLTFGLYNASSGMSIDPDSGEFSWTPTEAQGMGAAYFFSIIVSDTAGLTDTTVVMIMVNELNEAPVLAAIGDQTLAETQLFTLTLEATDNDLPANSLSYSLTNAPAGATLDDASGLFSWTPDASQGPGEYTVTFIVSDDGSPVLTDSETITLSVSDSPGVVITESGGSTDVDEDGTITAGYHVVLNTQPGEDVTITITSDNQVETSQTSLTFTPDNWDEAQSVLVSAVDDTVYEGPHTGQITHAVSSLDPTYDGLSIAGVSANIDDNDPLPSLDIGDVTVDEGVGTATVAVTLTGESIYPASVSYTIADGTASGSGVDYSALDGTLTWPSLTHGSQNIAVTIINDDFIEDDETVNISLSNPISATIISSSGVLTIVSEDVNTAPVLAPIGSQTVEAGETLTFTLVATDTDVPTQTLTYGLSNAPLGATISPTTGLFTWATLRDDGPAIYSATLSVSDGLLTDTETITITVTKTAQADIGDYVLFGLNSVSLQQSTEVYSGHVGAQDASPGPVLDSGAEVSLGRSVIFHDPASEIAADTVALKQNSSVYDIFANELAENNATYNQFITPLTMPVVTNLPDLPNITPGSSDYNVKKGESLSLAAGAYGTVDVKQDATLTLTGGVYHLSSLALGKNATLLITAPTEIRLAGRLSTGQNVIIGPAAGSGLTGADLVLFIAGINGSDGLLESTPKAIEVGNGSAVTASLYAPNGTLLLGQEVTARGAFIALDVETGKGADLWHESAFANGSWLASISALSVDVKLGAGGQIFLPLVIKDARQ